MFKPLNVTVFALAFMIAMTRYASAGQGPERSTVAQTDKAGTSASPAGQGKARPSPSEDRGQEKDAKPGEAFSPQVTVIPATSNTVSDTELQSYIQNALSKDPTLSGISLRVVVSEDRIELSGNVARSKEKQAATRIAQSFAGNKKMVNQITISAGSNTTPAATQTPAGSQTSPRSPDNRGVATPAVSPQPNEGLRPPLR